MSKKGKIYDFIDKIEVENGERILISDIDEALDMAIRDFPKPHEALNQYNFIYWSYKNEEIEAWKIKWMGKRGEKQKEKSQ